MFIYFLVIRRVRLLHLRSSRFVKAIGGLKKKKKVAGNQMEELLTISSPGSRHSGWCHDRDGVHECTVRQLRAQQHATAGVRAHDMGTTRATGFSLAPGRDINFCVTTWLGWDMLVLGHDMIFHVATWAAIGAS